MCVFYFTLLLKVLLYIFQILLLLLLQHLIPELGSMLTQDDDLEDSIDGPVVISSEQTDVK